MLWKMPVLILQVSDIGLSLLLHEWGLQVLQMQLETAKEGEKEEILGDDGGEVTQE